MKVRLSVSYCLNPDTDFRKIDYDLESIVGHQRSDSGAGFGYRDMGWQDIQREDVEDIIKQIKEKYPQVVECSWRELEQGKYGPC